MDNTEQASHTMRVVQFDRYGGPDVLRVTDSARPEARPGEVLIRVRATSVNQHDVFVRSGRLRVLTGSRFPLGIGVDFAGEVVTDTSERVTHLPGDRVWGTIGGLAHRFAGSAAEYVSVAPEQISIMPATMSFTEAASVVAGGTAALTAVRDEGKLQPGNRVLIRGGVGAVGNVAVQYAHAIGAHVTALVRRDQAELALSLGADVALDETAFTQSPADRFDLIVDSVGTDLRALRRRLSHDGRMVTVAFASVGAISYIALSALHGRRRVRAFLGAPKTALLQDLAALASARSIKPLIAATYSLEDIVQAHIGVVAKVAPGKHVVTVD